MGKHDKVIDRTLQACDAIEEAVGASKAPAAAILAARLMAGSEIALTKAIEASVGVCSWDEVTELHEAALAEPAPDEEEDDDREPGKLRRIGGGRR